MSSTPLELLYQLTFRDAASVLWTPFYWASGLVGGGVDPIIITRDLEADSVYFLTESYARVQPAVGVILESFSISIADTGGNRIFDLQREGPYVPTLAAGERVFKRATHDCVVVGAAQTLLATGKYSAANAGNLIEAQVAGYKLPRGNVALP